MIVKKNVYCWLKDFKPGRKIINNWVPEDFENPYYTIKGNIRLNRKSRVISSHPNTILIDVVVFRCGTIKTGCIELAYIDEGKIIRTVDVQLV